MRNVKLLTIAVFLIFSLVRGYAQVLGQEVQKYVLDTAQSKLLWKCSIHHGYIKFKSGHLEIQKENIIAASLVADMQKIYDLDIDYELMRQTLENILKSSEFFDVNHYPESYFNLDIAKQKSASKYVLQGDLNVLGGDQCVELEISLSKKEKMIKITSDSFKTDRTKYGITLYSKRYPSEENNPQKFEVPDEIVLHVELYFSMVQE